MSGRFNRFELRRNYGGFLRAVVDTQANEIAVGWDREGATVDAEWDWIGGMLNKAAVELDIAIELLAERGGLRYGVDPPSGSVAREVVNATRNQVSRLALDALLIGDGKGDGG